MLHHCPFPVRSTDSRRSYRTGSVPGFTLCLALIAALSGYASLSEAAPPLKAQAPARSGAVIGWAQGRVLAAPRTGLSDKERDKALKLLNAKSKGRLWRGNAM